MVPSFMTQQTPGNSTAASLITHVTRHCMLTVQCCVTGQCKKVSGSMQIQLLFSNLLASSVYFYITFTLGLRILTIN